MAGSIPVPQREEEAWSRALGYFIWSMGTLEWQTYEWGFKFGGHALKDELIGTSKFASRQKKIVDLIDRQNWPSEKKRRAKLLWKKAKGFARFRNVLAHNPVIMNRNYPGLFGVVDVRALKGGHNRYHRIYFAQIVYQTAQKLQIVALALGEFFEE
jgi:hypothetical protein